MARVSGKGSKKYGRNEAKCKKYKNAGRREKNRDKRIKKVIKELEKANPSIKYKAVKAKGRILNIVRDL